MILFGLLCAILCLCAVVMILRALLNIAVGLIMLPFSVIWDRRTTDPKDFWEQQ